MPTEYRVREGGLMRCCLATLDAHMLAATEAPKEGETLECRYEKNQPRPRMRWRKGAWEWNRDDL